MSVKTTPFLTKLAAWKGGDYVLLAVALGLLAALVLPTIGNASIWFDEAFSAYISHFNFLQIAQYTASDVHPPLYYWLLKLWETIFGYTSPIAVRSMSLLFAGIAAVLGFLLVRRLFGRKAAALSLLFTVISPMIIRYSEEARMYMLELAIIFAATYVLTFAVEQKKRRLWVLYGILVGLGMWTHYFTALAWLAHWVWRYITIRQMGARGKELRKQFLTKDWIIAHIVAIGIFLPWLPFMLIQLTIVQGGGFWIGPIGVDTPMNYLSNMFYYLQNNQTQSWLAILLLVVVIGFIITIVRVYQSLNAKQRQWYILLISLATVPVILLMLASLPPLRSSFVERYLIPSTMATMLLLGVTITYGLIRAKLWQRIVVVIVIVAMFSFGISSVYYYGNYNKNSNVHILTGQLIQQIDQEAKPGEPIIANSPWIFYEAVFYSNNRNPVYFIDADTQYIYGSLDMLQDNDQHKIKDIAGFLKQHPTVWYIGNTTDSSVTSDRTKGWTDLRTIGIHDSIQNVTLYKATDYQTNVH